MAEFATIARPYAKALFSLAQEQNHIESWLSELKTLAEVVMQPKMQVLIEQPECEDIAKAQDILSVLDKEPDAELKNFVLLLAQNKRLLALPEIYALFQDYALSRNNIKEAIVYTAYQLDDTQFKHIVTELEQHFSSKLAVRQIVDAELIGGVKVAVGDQVLDLSVQGRLNSLHAALMN
ncbi:F0F1 ATP synthase subunit delta [Neisseriaceae bacterium ESL0693]|nr:F0F1 ATP synthase subunit delta [Neisseriaceae bacterium ESL0693]